MAPRQPSPTITTSNRIYGRDVTRAIDPPKPPIAPTYNPPRPGMPGAEEINFPRSSVKVLQLIMSMESQIQTYINKRNPPRPLELEGLSWDQFVQLRDNAKLSIPGWNKLKYLKLLFLCYRTDLTWQCGLSDQFKEMHNTMSWPRT